MVRFCHLVVLLLAMSSLVAAYDEREAIREAVKMPRFRETVAVEESVYNKDAVQQAAVDASTAPTEDMDAQDKELQDALQIVRDQIVAKANSIKSEKRWVKEVTEIIEAYVKKTRRVNAHIRDTQKEVKEFFRKKKQIENMILQRRLEKKLQQANDDLKILEDALHNVQTKEETFEKSKHDIRSTIAAIETELAKLRGEQPANKEERKECGGSNKDECEDSSGSGPATSSASSSASH